MSRAPKRPRTAPEGPTVELMQEGEYPIHGEPAKPPPQQCVRDKSLIDLLRYITPAQRKHQKSKGTADQPAVTRVHVQFRSTAGDTVGTAMEVPGEMDGAQLEELLNTVMKNVRLPVAGLTAQDEPLPYSFFVNQQPLASDIGAAVAAQRLGTESTVAVEFVPQAVFRVRAVSRCTASLPGHSAPIIVACFSPDGRWLATGAGDCSVWIWDLDTQTPLHTFSGHTQWILCLGWSPDATRLVSGDKGGTLRLWNPETGKQMGHKGLKGHTKWITDVSWEPFHLNAACSRFASASKDGTVRLWDASTRRCLNTISASAGFCVSCLRWGGEGLIYTGSHDRTVKVFAADGGTLVRVLAGHAHWVNTMALSTDHALRSGVWDHTCGGGVSKRLTQAEAVERYERVKHGVPERLATGSDDFTIFLWEPSVGKKPLARLTGHQGLVNQVRFSPDGLLLASASFDKSVKIWSGTTGQFRMSLRGHVGPVYQLAWSSDSRMLVSGSRDSTLKLWNLKEGKILEDLPGHADEVYAVDWSPDSAVVASGSKDAILKLWRA